MVTRSSPRPRSATWPMSTGHAGHHDCRAGRGGGVRVVVMIMLYRMARVRLPGRYLPPCG